MAKHQPTDMHFRNGRSAQNGDKIVKLQTDSGKIVSFGVLHDATPGNDYCNGGIAPIVNDSMACMCDCLHVDDLAAIIADAGLDTRPDGRPDYVCRMAAELRALNKKRDALVKFIESNERYDDLPIVERARMNNQLEAMTHYADILAERLQATRP